MSEYAAQGSEARLSAIQPMTGSMGQRAPGAASMAAENGSIGVTFIDANS
jgi:hypothetical protein